MQSLRARTAVLARFAPFAVTEIVENRSHCLVEITGVGGDRLVEIVAN
jgi:hypothetical protein